MLFNSSTFFIFFTVVLFFYTSPLSTQSKKIFLLLASYFFYAAWNPPFVLLLIFSTLVDWFAAQKISTSQEKHQRKYWMALSLLINLGLLAFFKYWNFFLENFIVLLQMFHVDYQPASFSVILPVGISFYTFQTLSYTLDVYRDRRHCSKSFVNFALYVTFFPQLVAGPIVRSKDFLSQCNTFNHPCAKRILTGLSWMILGLFEKVVIADFLMAPIVDAVYSQHHAVSSLDVWTATFAFSIQIFCDFAGYSTCAIGAAYALGFELPRNFNFPYAAHGFSDFWKRWHISLSTWLRDYLYIPLGGNQKNRLTTFRNLGITMFLGGLWHGASWTFVFWGILHAVFLIIERLMSSGLEKKSILKTSRWNFFSVIITYLCVCFAWMFFRSQNLEQILFFSKTMFYWQSLPSQIETSKLITIFSLTALTLILHSIFREHDFLKFCSRLPQWLVFLCVTFMTFCIFIAPTDGKSFIYFQF
jgi:alginate O-acetyltransferase complex protein AlgI